MIPQYILVHAFRKYIGSLLSMTCDSHPVATRESHSIIGSRVWILSPIFVGQTGSPIRLQPSCVAAQVSKEGKTARLCADILELNRSFSLKLPLKAAQKC